MSNFIIYENGNEYIGKLKDGKRHGKGQMKYSDILSYHGNWKVGEKSGKGELRLSLQDFFILGGDDEKNIQNQSDLFYSLRFKNDKYEKQELCPMLQGKCLFGLEKYSHYLFIFGGFDGNRCIDNIDRYDFFTNKWENIAFLSERRSGCVSVMDTKNSKIYIIGGTQKGIVLNLIEEYDILTNKCSNFITSKSKRTCGGAVYFEGKIYMFGGLKYTENDLYMEILDLKEKKITLKEHILLNIMGAGYCFGIMDSRPCIFVVGGDQKEGLNQRHCYTNKFFYYDIQKDEIYELPSPFHKRKYSSLVFHQQCLYLIGGYDGEKIVSDIEIFSLVEKKWEIKNTNIIDKCGSGVLAVDNEKFLLQGVWKNNLLEGKAKVFFNEKCISSGKYKKNKKEGYFDEEGRIFYQNNLILPEEELKLQKKLKRRKIPEQFICPIGYEIMRNPVITSCGTTYEEKNIKKWLETKDTDPLIREEITDNLIPNLILKSLIQHYLEK